MDCISGHWFQVERGETVGSRPRLDSTDGDDQAAEQRTSTQTVRTEGQHGRSVGGAPSRYGCFSRCTER